MPFWSSASRAERVIAAAPAYAAFETVSLPVIDWQHRWLPGLRDDGLLIGINWSGERASGYDLEPDQVLDRLSAHNNPS